MEGIKYWCKIERFKFAHAQHGSGIKGDFICTSINKAKNIGKATCYLYNSWLIAG